MGCGRTGNYPHFLNFLGCAGVGAFCNQGCSCCEGPWGSVPVALQHLKGEVGEMEGM